MICEVSIEKAYYGNKQVLEDIEFSLNKGDILAIVGESGAGKTTLGRLVSGLYVFYPLRYHGKINISGVIDVVPQNITDSLDPIFTIESQMKELTGDESLIKKTLLTVGFDDVGIILKSYPHNLSGGMRQRVLIAMAILRADIILADEFTSALDTITKIRIVNLLKKLNIEKRLTIIFITHDMELLDFDGQLIVIFDGKIVEKGSVSDIKLNPEHPYTKFLLNSSPKPGMHYRNRRFEELKINYKYACPFFESCLKRNNKCKTNKPPLKTVNGRSIRCHF